MARPENYRTEEQRIQGVEVVITTYRIGETYYCKIANKDPGATIVRAKGIAEEDVKKQAIAKAAARLE